ncbi:9722_t:CDS:2 [Ambispora leptoticha]|uniref:9722_t:CDS:1 n=1 Tax=Ambispora leptoticha TaxID=144679 RepID=A0A9N9GTK8_9GLOM|nr:9722_t:CDS:2 [Ambispora leptoticha]
MTENHIGVLEAEQKLVIKQEFTQQIKMYAKSATRSTMQILNQNSRPSTPLQTTNTSHEAHTSPGSMDSLSILSTSTRSKRKMANLPKYDQNIKIRLLECQSSESDYEENDYLADSADDEEDYIAQDADFFLDPFADNNEEGGWMLDGGSSVRNMLNSKTYEALELMKKSKKRDSCVLSVIRLGLSSIIDLSSEFPGGMHEWFGKDWPTLKAKALEHLNVTTKQFDDPVKIDIKKIMENCTSYYYSEAKKFILEKLMDESTGILHQQIMKCYYFVLDMFLSDPHVFVDKEGKKKNLSEMDYVIKFIGPILNIIFSDVQHLSLKWGETVAKTVHRKIDLRIVCRENDTELSHSECARAVTRVKITQGPQQMFANE